MGQKADWLTPVPANGANGGMRGTNGVTFLGLTTAELRLPRPLWGLYAACLIVVAAVTATSFWMEAARYGHTSSFATLAVNEATSVAVIFALTWPLLVWAVFLSRPRTSWTSIGAGHVLGLLAFDLAHIGGMTGLRMLVFGVLGQPYDPPPFWECFTYELRKDVLVYAGLVTAILLLRRALRRQAPARPADGGSSPAGAARIEIRDGARRSWIDAGDILWIEAAGNYVELHLGERTQLWRRTLSAVEADLGAAGFQRVHRSRLVNLRHVRNAASNDSGDFTLTLSNGATVAGARRWREAFERAVATAP